MDKITGSRVFAEITDGKQICVFENNGEIRERRIKADEVPISNMEIHLERNVVLDEE
jgi:uncharacterized protein YehS (DUF1456 family)